MKNIKILLISIFLIFILLILEVSANDEYSLEEGRYYIYSSLNDKYALDVINNNIELSKENYSPTQTWDIYKLNNGSYRIVNGDNSDYSLDLYNENKEPGTNVQIYFNNDTGAQQWIIKKTTSNKYKIISKSNKLVLDIKDGTIKGNNNIQVNKDNNSDSQRFIFVPVVDLDNNALLSDGNYLISSSNDKNYNISTSSPTFKNKNVNIELKKYNGSIDEYWNIKKLSNGYYKIISNRDNNYSLEVYKGNKENGTNIKLSKNSDSINQEFKIIRNENNTYTIISRANGLVLDIENGIMRNRTNIQTYESNNTSAQEWNLIKEDNTYDNSKELSLNNLKTEAKKLMIVAHPDDETLWGSHALRDDKYLVICVTCGPTRRDRMYEFKAVMNKTDDDYMMLGFPDLVNGKKSEWKEEYPVITEQLEKIINSKRWNMVVTHNPEGEYGHIHHKMLNRIVTEKTNHKILSYFGKYYRENLPQEIITNKISDEYFSFKKELMGIYETQNGAIENLKSMHHYENWLTYYEWYSSISKIIITDSNNNNMV